MDIKVLATGSSGNAYLVQQGDDMLLLDAGIGYEDIMRAVGWQPAALQGVLVSHSHQDHLKATKTLAEAYIHVYASEQTFAAAGVSTSAPNVHVLAPRKPVSIGKWLVNSFETHHDAEGSLGFYFAHKDSEEKILYATDTGYIPVMPTGLTALLVECNHMDGILLANKDELQDRFARLNKYHMSLERVVSYLRKIDKSKLHTIVLLHMSDSNIIEDKAIAHIKRLTGCNVYSADAGMEISLDCVPF